MPVTPSAEVLLRELAPQVLGAVVRRYGHFETAEDAVQEALLAAFTQWPRDGVPQEPRAWLVRVASRKLIDMLRGEQARRRREDTDLARALSTDPQSGGVDSPAARDHDDSLQLLFLCCHPSLTAASQVALTLRAVGGLTTAEIARAFLVPEPTMAQRVSRAKKSLTEEGGRFRMPSSQEYPARLRAVLHVLYLIFNEGYTSTSGPRLHRVELTAEAIRLARLMRRSIPEDGEVSGLLALMVLTDARRGARTTAEGDLVPLGEQDRGLWDKGLVAEGVDLVTEALSLGTPGPYQLQAAIAAVHAEAERVEDTDWRQILALYELLEQVERGNPAVVLNHAVAAAMVYGPRVGLAMLARLDTDPRMSRNHRLVAVRAHLLDMAGDHEGAVAAYRSAARQTASAPERRYLENRAEALRGAAGSRPIRP